ncbi:MULTISPECIES: hypothetical protein [Thermomonospora]|uniref:NurA domain-containing protein n=1 Tax=Thermomonospora cellulosilytica TaxID=1411118 RepID=A0A7W3MZM2_9ACTN|nr:MULTISPECIES: hypothetical protein [Thermomonospora]MBA9004805.1 hypothetical protein [Thermomonospora cellulosilytica]
MTIAPAPPAPITIDPWDPGYATSVTAGALTEMDATTAEINLDVEVPAARWSPVTPAAVALPSAVLIADGVRRIEARVWVSDPGGAMPAPGIAASYAAGVVRCGPTGRPAELVDVGVRRSLFTPSQHAADLHTWAGEYTVRSAAGASAEQLSLALQRDLGDLEVTLATRHRSHDAGDDLLIIDGPLRGRSQLPRTVGYVKTHHTAYLSGRQAGVMAELRPGQRTPVFLMGSGWPRHSWYLRLPTRSTAPWSGIARCEAGAELTPAEVVALADLTATVLPALAGVDYKDPRAPQNLVPIGGLERLLRHRLGDARLLYRALRQATALTP